MLLRLFTRVPLEEIISICDQDIRKAKTLMAYEITKLVHGEDEATKALQTAKELFGKKSSSKHMPMCQQDKALIANNISLIDLLCITGFVPSKSEARRLITQGGISVNQEKILQAGHVLTTKDLHDDHLILKRGKKNHLKVVFSVTVCSLSSGTINNQYILLMKILCNLLYFLKILENNTCKRLH